MQCNCLGWQRRFGETCCRNQKYYYLNTIHHEGLKISIEILLLVCHTRLFMKVLCREIFFHLLALLSKKIQSNTNLCSCVSSNGTTFIVVLILGHETEITCSGGRVLGCKCWRQVPASLTANLRRTAPSQTASGMRRSRRLQVSEINVKCL